MASFPGRSWAGTPRCTRPGEPCTGPGTAVFDEVLRPGAAAGPQCDERHRLLAEHRVRLADDRGLKHRRVTVEHVLDLLGVDVLAAPDDEVLDPVHQRQVPILVEPADVAGVQPAAAQYLGRLAGPAEVPAHHVRPAHDHLTGLAGRQQPVLAVDDPDVDAGQWQPCGPGLAGSMQRVERAADRAFRQAIAFHDGHAVALLELSEQLPRHRGSAADDEAEALGVGLPAGPRHEQGVDGRDG